MIVQKCSEPYIPSDIYFYNVGDFSTANVIHKESEVSFSKNAFSFPTIGIGMIPEAKSNSYKRGHLIPSVEMPGYWKMRHKKTDIRRTLEVGGMNLRLPMGFLFLTVVINPWLAETNRRCNLLSSTCHLKKCLRLLLLLFLFLHS